MRSAMSVLVAMSLAVLVTLSEAQTAPITIDFETVPDVTPSAAFNVGDSVPATARLSDQLLATYGVLFASLQQPYVALVELGTGHAVSGKNGIGAVTAANTISYSDDFTVAFFDKQNQTMPAVTDFVSIRSDKSPTLPTPIRLEGYSVGGTLLASDSQIDGFGVVLSVSSPNIHYVRVLGNGSSAFDDLSFNAPVAVPEPAAVFFISAGLTFGSWQLLRRRNSQRMRPM